VIEENQEARDTDQRVRDSDLFSLGVPAFAAGLGAAFVPVRKPGKLPGQCVEAKYEKEYGTDSFQLQEGSIQPGQTVIVIDDLIATGESPASELLGAGTHTRRSPQPSSLVCTVGQSASARIS
jgi:orotate phosphoribosyltransferase